jgi:hypothetical protein
MESLQEKGKEEVFCEKKQGLLFTRMPHPE